MHPSRGRKKHHKWQNASPLSTPNNNQHRCPHVCLLAKPSIVSQSRRQSDGFAVDSTVPPIPAIALLLIATISPQTQFAPKRLLFQLKPRRRETQICTGKGLKKKKKHHHLPPFGRAPSQFASGVDGASGRTRV